MEERIKELEQLIPYYAKLYYSGETNKKYLHDKIVLVCQLKLKIKEVF